MAVKTDYTGRSVDLFIFGGAKPQGQQDIALSFVDNAGQLTTGIQKAIQTFVMLLLTESGTRQGDSNFGTTFLTELRQANITSGAIPISFRVAVETILDQQRLYITAVDDETIDTVELLDFSVVDKTNVKLSVKLTTLAGDSRDIILPVSLAIK